VNVSALHHATRQKHRAIGNGLPEKHRNRVRRRRCNSKSYARNPVLIALHSADALLETGLCMRPPEKSQRPRSPVSSPFSVVRFVEKNYSPKPTMQPRHLYGLGRGCSKQLDKGPSRCRFIRQAEIAFSFNASRPAHRAMSRAARSCVTESPLG